MTQQTLSFQLSLANSQQDLDDVCAVRSESYGHHLPELHDPLRHPDSIDTDPATVIFLCRDKASGAAIGTARVQTSRHRNLLIEQCAEAPAAMKSQDRAEISRFSASRGADPLVKLALWKASYLYCHSAQARWMIIGARSEALCRQYQRLGFRDIYDDQRMVSLTYAGGVPHHILGFDVLTAERTWFESNNPLYNFMIETTHPDISLLRPAQFAQAPSRAAMRAPALALAPAEEAVLM